jgi:hypothetical protein
MSEPAEGPAGVAAAAFRALEAERGEELVGWLDPEAVEAFRVGQLRCWKEAGERRPLTAPSHCPRGSPQTSCSKSARTCAATAP